MDLNWALFIVTEANNEEGYEVGESGVLRTNMSPGMRDDRNGILYIAPNWYVIFYAIQYYDGKMDDPNIIHEAVIDYFRNNTEDPMAGSLRSRRKRTW